jgi:hypothetical protein
MKKSMVVAAAAMMLGSLAPVASAAPLAGARDNPMAQHRLVEPARVVYHRHCYWTGKGWGYHYRGRILVCKPYRPKGHGWIWYHEGHRHGWYHPHRKVWHYNKW